MEVQYRGSSTACLTGYFKICINPYLLDIDPNKMRRFIELIGIINKLLIVIGFMILFPTGVIKSYNKIAKTVPQIIQLCEQFL